MACDPTTVVVPPACPDRDPGPPIPRTCPNRDGGACNMGDGSACDRSSAFPELGCVLEMECDQDIPLVVFTAIPGVQTVDLTWDGVLATDEIEWLITGIFEDYNDDPLVPFYELNDYDRVQDVDAPNQGTNTMGVFVNDRVYSVHARRIRDGKVGMWSTTRTVGQAGAHTYIVDGPDIIVDDYVNAEVGVRVAPIPIIDDEVP